MDRLKSWRNSINGIQEEGMENICFERDPPPRLPKLRDQGKQIYIYI